MALSGVWCQGGMALSLVMQNWLVSVMGSEAVLCGSSQPSSLCNKNVTGQDLTQKAIAIPNRY